MNSITIQLPADENADDCLTTAAALCADRLDLAGWDLGPRWADETREAVALTIPGHAAAALVLCESADGWSLHAPGAMDDDIASGAAPYLASGTGEPGPADYAAALVKLCA